MTHHAGQYKLLMNGLRVSVLEEFSSAQEAAEAYCRRIERVAGVVGPVVARRVYGKWCFFDQGQSA